MQQENRAGKGTVWVFVWGKDEAEVWRRTPVFCMSLCAHSPAESQQLLLFLTAVPEQTEFGNCCSGNESSTAR